MLQSVVIRWERPETVFEATAIIGNNCEFRVKWLAAMFAACSCHSATAAAADWPAGRDVTRRQRL